MATYNGRRWIEPQVDSILSQRGVSVSLFISDDGSTDGTLDYLRERADADPRVHVVAPRGGPPGVAANFLHLFSTHPLTADRIVAFSDQDDIWRPDKLNRQVEMMRASRADAVSSNVVSFDSSGRQRLIVKSAPQRRWDYLFEAAGPGSTYVFTPSMHARLVQSLSTLDVSDVGVHDWFLYALTRALGGKWVIDPIPTVEYRQHGDNVQGEHRGPDALRSRLAGLRSGFYRQQFILTAAACLDLGAGLHDAEWNAELRRLAEDLRQEDLAARLRVARRYREIRRNPKEGLELAVACVLHLW